MKLFLPAICLMGVTAALPQAARAGCDPQEPAALIRRAAACYAKGQHDQALQALDEALRRDPNNALALSCRGAIWFAKKEYDRAITDLDAAIRIEPSKPSSGYYLRGAAWYMKKEYAKGVKDLDEAIRLDPRSVDALNSRAWAAATCPEARYRDRAKAIDYAKRACELDGWKNAFYLGTLAAAYADNGDFGSAVKWQRKALADPWYAKECGDEGRQMLQLFEQGRPYREAAVRKK